DVEPRYLRGGFLGAPYAPFQVATGMDNPADPGFRVAALAPPDGLTPSRLAAAGRLLGAADSPPSQRAPVRADDTFRQFQERAFDLVTGPEAQRAFDLNREPASVRDRYGRHPLGQNLLMARRLIEAGVRLVSVTAWCGTPPGERFRNVQTWDMHGEGAGLGSIFGSGAYGLGWALSRVDEAVSGAGRAARDAPRRRRFHEPRHHGPSGAGPVRLTAFGLRTSPFRAGRQEALRSSSPSPPSTVRCMLRLNMSGRATTAGAC